LWQEEKNKKMKSQNIIAIVIPCYNESQTITKVVHDFHAQLPNALIFVFDNNSTDGSKDLAKKAGDLVKTQTRQGKGFVVASMLQKIQADYYIMVDADDTYPAEYSGALLDPLIEEKADMVVGQRLSEFDKNAFRSFHIFGNKVICGLLNSIFHSKLKDPLSGYRAFTREVALQLPVVASGFDIETELTLQMLYRHLIIEEISIPYRARPSGSISKLSTIKDGLRVLLKIFSILRSYKPLTFFGSLAIVSEVIAIGSGMLILINYLNSGEGINIALAIICSSFFIIGIYFASIGIIINSLNFRLLENMSVLEKQIHWIKNGKQDK
jgi:glycosyltransferase involved in cell wall biosynthesis